MVVSLESTLVVFTELLWLSGWEEEPSDFNFDGDLDSLLLILILLLLLLFFFLRFDTYDISPSICCFENEKKILKKAKKKNDT